MTRYPLGKPGAAPDTLMGRLRERDLLGVVKTVARMHRVTIGELLGKSRVPHVAEARRHAMATVLWTTSLTPTFVGWLFGVDRTTVDLSEREWGKQLEVSFGIKDGPWAAAARSKMPRAALGV